MKTKSRGPSRRSIACRRTLIERLEPRWPLAAGFIELGPSDNIALDQPRVAVELAKDIDPGPGVQWESIGPGLFNTFLLDTGASSVLAMATAIADIEQSRLGYEVQGALLETGVAGDHLLDVSIPYRFDFAGSNGIRHTMTDVRIMSDAAKDFSSLGPWGLVGMPAMVNRVTSLDFTGWSGGGLDLDSIYMGTEFRDDVPAGNGHRYTISLDNRLSFDPLDQMVSGEPPVWGDVPFVTGMPKHKGVAQEGNFLFDTGAQISVISERLAIDIGLDSNGDGKLDQSDANYVTQQVVGGVGGQISVPVFGFDEFHLTADSGEDLVWTNLEWLVLDISTPGQDVTLDGVLGSDLLTSGWFHAFFSPGQPDGYINQVHMDFREMESSGTGKVHFDLNPSVDNVVLPGPGILLRQSFRTTDVGEGGDADSYDIVLTGAPTGDVTITLDNAEGQVTVENAVDGTNSLVFTPQNWETPQTVLVTAVNDLAAEGNHRTLISHAVSSSDSGYDNRAIPDVTVRITDDDLNLLKITSDQAGQSPINSVETSEGGGTVYYWVSLSEQPVNEFWVLFEDTSGQSEAIKADNPQLGLENVLMFNIGNWNQPQRVAINALNDTLQEGRHQTRMIHTVLDVLNFADPILGQTPLLVNVIDDDLGEVAITPSGDDTMVGESAMTDTYQISLNMQPTGPVEITVRADAQTRISVDGGVTFAETQVLSLADMSPRTMVVAAIDDDVVEDTHFGRITHAISGVVNDDRFSTDLVIDPLRVTIDDNDTAGVVLTTEPPGGSQVAASALEDSVLEDSALVDSVLVDSVLVDSVLVDSVLVDSVGEMVIRVAESGEDATYWVALKSQPLDAVTVFLGSNDRQAIAVDAALPANEFLTFDATNWNLPQAVRLSARNDPTVEGLHASQIDHRFLSADSNYRGNVLLPLEITDDDVAGFALSKHTATVSEDTSTADTFLVSLTAQPTSNVVISVVSDDPGEVVADPIELTFLPSSWDVAQVITLTGVSDGIDDGNQLSVVRINVVDQASSNAFDALPEQTIEVTTLDQDAPLFDFGDAPGVAESAMANDYPVTLSQDGARHAVGVLYLGALIDGEADGQPAALAGRDGLGGDDGSGDGDEDGVSVYTMISGASTTISSVSVHASGQGKLDAWIDFNRDGDWDDPAEQILVSVDVVAGENLLGFSVPAGAVVGDTAARFRLSSAGGLAPTGSAVDGEVEDHWVSIADGGAAPAVALDLFNHNVTIALGASSLSVRSLQTDLFRAPTFNVGSLRIHGDSGDDTLTIDAGSGALFPIHGLQLLGGSGENTLVVVGDHETIDLTSPLFKVSGFKVVDLAGRGAAMLVLNTASVAAMSPATGVGMIRGSTGDRIMFFDAPSWRMSDPVSRNGEFWLTATNRGSGGSESIEAALELGWQNFVQPSDVNNDGSTTGLDALRIINELGRRHYSDEQTQELADPATVGDWPHVYFDQSGDNRVTALDALRVINELGRQFDRGDLLESEATFTFLIATTQGESPSQSRPLITQDVSHDPMDEVDWVDGFEFGSVLPAVISAAISPDQNVDSGVDSTEATDYLLADQTFLDLLC